MEAKVAETGPQKGGSQVRIVARIEKMAGGFYGFDGKTFDSGVISHNASFQLTAGTPGTYGYFCRIHPFMKATLTVTP